MKFSVLTPAYQAARFLPTALASLRAQEHQDWEWIVYEDGSADGTEALVRAFAAGEKRRVHYENPGRNLGVAAARNRLLELAEGDAVAFLDADDWWTPRHLLRARAVLEAGADFAVARLRLCELDPPRERETCAPPPEFYADPVRGLLVRSAIMTSSCVVLRRAMVEKTGRFDQAFSIGEDRDYWLRCALGGGRFADTGEVTCHYAKHPGSAMAGTLRWAQQEVAFLEKHAALAIVPEGVRRAALAQALGNHGRLLRQVAPTRSAVLLWRAWRLAPADVRMLGHALYSLVSAGRRGAGSLKPET